MARNRGDDGVLVIGLGRFGSALAETLLSLGLEVLAIDADARTVQHYAGRLTHVVEADSTDEEALRQLGAAEFGRAVVAIGTDMEASILTTSILVDLGVKEVWSKAISVAHGRILERVGAHHVVFPEQDMGERVAHQVTGRMMDFIDLGDGFALVQTCAPADLVGRSLAEFGVRKRFGVTVVGVKRHGEGFSYATAETVVAADDVLIVAGEKKLARQFAARS